jgi:hypothetical protein
VGIRINDQDSNYFLARKGLRQGDPLSPIFFNMVADAYSKMINRDARQGLISGMLTRFRLEGIISLEYC